MFAVDGKNVTISKGDTGTLTITLTRDVPADGTTALVTLRKNINMVDAVWEKRIPVENGVVIIPLTSEDTNIPWFDYWWDIRLLYENGDIYTLFEPALFKVCGVVGDV